MSWKELDLKATLKFYEAAVNSHDTEALRRLCKEDLFFLLFYACKRYDVANAWLYARCREVEAQPNDHLDLWSREHYKSTIITYGKTIQDILINSEETIGIFSHTRPIAKSFLGQIKRELEVNTFLQNLFPEILYANPSKESPNWSMDNGITVKRKSNPKEATVEAWGLVDGSPISKHYSIMVYDDVVTRESVYTPEMISKVTEAFSLSLNLAGQNCRKRYIGTRYHANDTYQTIMQRGTATPRIYPCTDDGTRNGNPVLWTRQQMEDKFRDMGSYVASSQLLQNPLADNVMGFKTEWIEYWDVLRKTNHWNVYITVDPAGEKKRGSDNTVILVIGLAPDGNYYLLDGVRDRLNLTERTKHLFDFVRKWSPRAVGYEKYGMQSDIEHVRYVQQSEGYRFHIVPLGGAMGKNDRIRRLVPLFENHRFYLPRKLLFVTVEGRTADLTQILLNEEYSSFPVSSHDDIMDAMARITEEELGAVHPKKVEEFPLNVPIKEERYDPLHVNQAYLAGIK